MWKTGPPTSKDLPEVLQWGDGASRGPEAGSGLEVLLDRASSHIRLWPFTQWKGRAERII